MTLPSLNEPPHNEHKEIDKLKFRNLDSYQFVKENIQTAKNRPSPSTGTKVGTGLLNCNQRPENVRKVDKRTMSGKESNSPLNMGLDMEADRPDRKGIKRRESSNGSEEFKVSKAIKAEVVEFPDRPPMRSKRSRLIFQDPEKIFDKVMDGPNSTMSIKPKFSGNTSKSRRYSKNPSANELKDAAIACRFVPDALSEQEQERFPEISDSGSEEAVFRYCFIRNRILHAWLQDVRQTLTFKSVMEGFHYMDCKLVSKIYCYLERYGLINFGFHRVMQDPPVQSLSPKRKVVVIGAGISGVAAAQQLKRFGFEVVVLEGRKRLGGRIHTLRDPSKNIEAELGAMVITGLGGGNPLYVLSRQLNLKLYPIRGKCPLYDTTGQLVPAAVDRKVETEWNKLLDAAGVVSHTLDITEVRGKKLDLGKCIEDVKLLQLLIAKQQKSDELTGIEENQNSHEHVLNEILEAQGELMNALEKFDEHYKDTPSSDLHSVSETANKPLFDAHNEVVNAEKKLESLQRGRLDLMDFQKESEVETPVYLNAYETQVLNWHIANLEFANAAPISKISAKHWDQDDAFTFSGRHLLVKGGYSSVVKGLACGLNIQYNSAVEKVEYESDTAKVTVRRTQEWVGNQKEVISADAVLVTVPLGVLKSKRIKFQPSLPSWKENAIRNVGFGNLNKVLLSFKEVFWDDSVDIFGCISEESAERGLGFMFWNLSPCNNNSSPVLLGLIAGESANDCDTHMSDDLVVEKAMEKLRKMYGNKVTEPLFSKVTHWSTDPFTGGAYSYLHTDAEAEDYDKLSECVSSAKGSPATLFFAGEHTCRNYPATVHGAYLSGIREAGKIADSFFGESCSVYDHHPADFHRSASGVPGLPLRQPGLHNAALSSADHKGKETERLISKIREEGNISPDNGNLLT